MSKFNRFFAPTKIGFELSNEKIYIDYKDVEEVRRVLSANGKMHSRQRTKMNAQTQAKAALAVKRARYMALLPYNAQNR
jgi:small subunit ribosomal protein S18